MCTLLSSADQEEVKHLRPHVVVSSMVMHHIKDVDALIKTLADMLQPGGLLVLVDSLQFGDVDGYDRILESFPGRFHEPYYDGYIREDLDKLYAKAGLERVSHTPAFLSKVSVYRKPE